MINSHAKLTHNSHFRVFVANRHSGVSSQKARTLRVGKKFFSVVLATGSAICESQDPVLFDIQSSGFFEIFSNEVERFESSAIIEAYSSRVDLSSVQSLRNA